MKDFATYVENLATLVERVSDGRKPLDLSEFAPALDGEPSKAVRQLIGLEERRRDGIYFTGSKIAERVVSSLEGQISSTSVITDPACGGGDLLLAVAKILPLKSGLFDTLESWGQALQGTDIHSEFVNSTKLRLILQAVALGPQRSRVRNELLPKLFPAIKVADGLVDPEPLQASTHIITNPPYSMVSCPPECNWTSGAVNHAAVFIDFITKNIEPGTRVLAILPDVLRSGTRYSKWRDLIASRLSGMHLSLLGQFSSHADVDVFILDAKRRKRKPANRRTSPFSLVKAPDNVTAVGDRFVVHVGPVVPFRHKKKGVDYPFLTPENCPPWKTVQKIDTRRRFRGTVFTPPFVVIRRTSRSNDRSRAIGTVVAGKGAVAVENHLLVAIPISGTLKDCERLLKVLKSTTTSSWLNKHMCCRHLTVSSVTSIPWTPETA